MSEKEKEIIETLAAAIPDMSEFDKGYLLGKGETIADMRRAEKKETFLKKVERMRRNGINKTSEGQIHRCS